MMGELITSASITGAVEKVQAILDEPDEIVAAEAFYELDMTVCNILTRLDKLELRGDVHADRINKLESNQNNDTELPNISGIYTRISKLTERVESLEKTRVDDFALNIVGRLKTVEARQANQDNPMR
ncbi:MAG: hypothetical protein HOH03_10375 [Candidatus Marinimicrobia bacterium]|nr:hypothetical protein [Candidatus Neomarinimicrobiota bacterium]